MTRLKRINYLTPVSWVTPPGKVPLSAFSNLAMIQKLIPICLLLLLSTGLWAQTVTLKGAIRDAENLQPLSDATIVVVGSETWRN